jgi:nucleoside-diphosphate-sugar epimerase
MPQNIVITGGTGFIGSAIVATLLAHGFNVIVLIRPESDKTRLENFSNIDILTYTSLLSDETRADIAARNPDVFIHCAWHGVAGKDRNEIFQVRGNISLTLDSVELASASNCKHWIGLGSQAEYGNQNIRLDENAALRPTTLYGKAKLAAGIAALAQCEARGIIGTWCRVFSTYGPGDSPNWFIPFVIQEFLANKKPALTRCEQQWDYLFVRDAARAVVSLIVNQVDGVFNLGSGSSRPLIDYVEAIRAELNLMLIPNYGAVSYRPDQVMHLEADISKLSSRTGWCPQVNLHDGIRETIAFELSR